MPTVFDLLAQKQHRLQTIDATHTILEATQLMNDRGIGALVVTDQGRIVGIFSERDVLRRVVAMERAPADTRVAEVMTVEVLCCHPTTSLDEAREIMMHRRIRHLPVVNDEESPVGMISIGDLNAQQVQDQEQQIGNLQEYLYGRT